VTFLPEGLQMRHCPNRNLWSSYVNQITRVLAAVDFSKPARTAFEHALALSRRRDAELTVVHAVPGDRAFRWRARERIALIGKLRQAAKSAGVRLRVSVQHGDPAGVILLHGRTSRPDMIVLGTHQRSGFDRFRLGSVAETVTMQASQPVLIVPSSSPRAAGPAMSLKSVVVGIDFSAASLTAVERALSITEPDSRVTLLHVVPRIPLASASRYWCDLSEPEYQRLLAEDAWRRFQNMFANARTSRKVHARVGTGDPSTELARVATDVDADLILVGVTRRGAIGRRIFGSTAARLIRGAGLPVLAIPELTKQRRVPRSDADELAIAA
jgi:nucleotide-binding universal stress UspA family protein